MSGEPSPGHEVWATVVQAPEGIVGFWLFVLLQLEFNLMATCDVLVAAGLELGGYVQIVMASLAVCRAADEWKFEKRLNCMQAAQAPVRGRPSMSLELQEDNGLRLSSCGSQCRSTGFNTWFYMCSPLVRHAL